MVSDVHRKAEVHYETGFDSGSWSYLILFYQTRSMSAIDVHTRHLIGKAQQKNLPSSDNLASQFLLLKIDSNDWRQSFGSAFFPPENMCFHTSYNHQVFPTKRYQKTVASARNLLCGRTSSCWLIGERTRFCFRISR